MLRRSWGRGVTEHGVEVTLASGAQAQGMSFDEVEIVTHQLDDGLYYLEGAGGNIAVSVGEDGVLIVDDQFAPLSDKIMAAIRELTDKPVTFVINTHHHGDHVGGNEKFAAAGATSRSTCRRRRVPLRARL